METWQHCILIGLAFGIGTFAGFLAYRHYPDIRDESTSTDILVATCFLAILGAFALAGGVTYLAGWAIALPKYRGLAAHVCTALLLASYAPWVTWSRCLVRDYQKAHGRYLQVLTVRQAVWLRRHLVAGMFAATVLYVVHLTR